MKSPATLYTPMLRRIGVKMGKFLKGGERLNLPFWLSADLLAFVGSDPSPTFALP